MSQEIVVTNYETGEEFNYVPPAEIKILLKKDETFRKVALAIGINPVLQKLWGNIFGKENFAENHPREHHGDSINTPVLPSDGYLTRSNITDGKSTVLGNIPIDIKKMVGLYRSPTKLPRRKKKIANSEFQKSIQTEMESLFSDFEGGTHDLAILKPEHKHVCTVPFRSAVKQIYRVGNDGSIFPDKIPHHKIPNEKVFSTDPIVALNSSDQLKIFDGNQRMVFLLETIIDDKPMEYLMVAHAAAFVGGIESLVEPGKEIAPKGPLFKFHQGSSLSTIWPKEFSEKFQTLPEIEALTTKNRVLEVLEGQVIYERVN